MRLELFGTGERILAPDVHSRIDAEEGPVLIVVKHGLLEFEAAEDGGEPVRVGRLQAIFFAKGEQREFRAIERATYIDVLFAEPVPPVE